MNIEKQVEKAVGNKRAPKLGDKVLHRLSGKHGVVSEIGTVGTEHIVSVSLSSGKVLSKLNWREVSLDNSGMSFLPHQAEAFSLPAPALEAVEPVVTKLDGPISGESLLGELV
jgi:hypothetical protein